MASRRSGPWGAAAAAKGAPMLARARQAVTMERGTTCITAEITPFWERIACMLRLPRHLAPFAAALVLACPALADARARPPFPKGTITHIVFVIQENRSVDNLFNGFPGADTV